MQTYRADASSGTAVGVTNAVGGGLLRDILTGEEPLVFKPGQFYVLTALAGAGWMAFSNLTVEAFPDPTDTQVQVITIKNIESSIADHGWENGWIKPQPSARRTGQSVAVVGSGPMACLA